MKTDEEAQAIWDAMMPEEHRAATLIALDARFWEGMADKGDKRAERRLRDIYGQHEALVARVTERMGARGRGRE